MTIFVACILWCVHQNSIPTRPQPPNSRQVEERWAKARLFAATSRRVSKYCVILGVRLQQKKQWVLPGIPTICGCIPSSCLVRLHILCSYPNVWRLYTDLVERIPPKSNNFMYSPFSDQPQYQIVDCLISSYMYIYIYSCYIPSWWNPGPSAVLFGDRSSSEIFSVERCSPEPCVIESLDGSTVNQLRNQADFMGGWPIGGTIGWLTYHYPWEYFFEWLENRMCIRTNVG